MVSTITGISENLVEGAVMDEGSSDSRVTFWRAIPRELAVPSICRARRPSSASWGMAVSISGNCGSMVRYSAWAVARAATFWSSLDLIVP